MRQPTEKFLATASPAKGKSKAAVKEEDDEDDEDDDDAVNAGKGLA